MIYKHLGFISEEGKLSLYATALFKEDIRSLCGEEIELTLRKSGRRSNEQNKYYWGAIIPIVQRRLSEMGIRLTNERVHDMLKYKFLKVDYVSDDGEVFEGMRSTTDLGVGEFVQYIEDIKQWAAEYLSIDIPNAGEQTMLKID